MSHALTSTSRSRGQGLMWRSLVTIGALALFRLGLAIPLPGLDSGAVAHLVASGRMKFQLFSIFAIGVTPILSALLVVEILEMAFPVIARWEHNAPAHRLTMRRVRFGLALGIAAMQGVGVSHGYAGIAGLMDEGAGASTLIVITLVGATAFLLWLCEAITTWGLADGFWLLYASWILANEAPLMEDLLSNAAQSTSSSGADRYALVFLVAAIAALVWGGSRLRAETGEPLTGAIWTPLIATFVAPLLLVAVSLPFGGAAQVGGLAHLAILAVLILVLTFMREKPRDGGPRSNADAILASIQIVVCVGSIVATRWYGLSPVLDGAALIVVVATTQEIVATLRAAVRPTAAIDSGSA